jgi:hypothetical protein
MDWWVILIIIVAIPLVLFPAAFIWYMNVSGLYTVIRETQKRRVARKRRVRELRMAEEAVVREAR